MREGKRKENHLIDRRLAHTLIFSGTVLLLIAFLLMRYDVLGQVLSKLLNVLRPVIIGFALALTLHKPVCRVCAGLERLFQGKRFPCNAVAVLLVYLLLLGGLTGIVCIVVPQFVTSITDFSMKFNGYYDNLQALLQQENPYVHRFTDLTGVDPSNLFNMEKLKELFTQLSDYLPTVAEKVANWTSNVVNVIVDIVMGLVFSIYMLLSRKRLRSQMQRILKRMCSKRHYRLVSHYGHITFDTFSNFISGQLAEALILGVLCFLSMTIFHLEYPLMISVIIGITNLIPIVGPIVGTIPGALVLLLIHPLHAVFFVILVIVLQQIDSNLIYPRVVGSSIGLPAIWVLFAITVGGGIFGILGMMLGVPCMSVIYTVLREKVDGMPKRKNNSGKKRPHQKLRIPFFSKRTPASAEAEAEASTSESPEPEANAAESSES